MSSLRDSHATTEEHRPPSVDLASPGRQVLLCAFPRPVAVPLPRNAEIVGRTWLADAGLSDTEVSGAHLRFLRARDGVRVEDASSRNGTWIDGSRTPAGASVSLQDGAVLRVGRTVFVYREAFAFGLDPGKDVGSLVGPWGLGHVRALLEDLVTRTHRNILIQGETGTGKELIAAAVFYKLARAKVAHVNVAGIAAGVFEGQLFGWVKGAFSGSGNGQKGVLVEHDRGGVLLDEIGELPLELQPKLLRVLENREVLPVGANRPSPVDVILVGATNRPLDEAVARGLFRRDLLARFTARIALPALADRAEDTYFILAALTRRHGAPLDAARAEVEAVERLLLDDLPANARDLDRVARTLGQDRPLTLAAVEGLLGRRAPSQELTRDAAERLLAEHGSERKAATRAGVSRRRLRAALGRRDGSDPAM